MRIGFAGLIHGHVWGLIDRFCEVPEMQLAAVADKTPLLDKAMERFATSYQDWREMLAHEKLDGLVVTSDNRESAEIASRITPGRTLSSLGGGRQVVGSRIRLDLMIQNVASRPESSTLRCRREHFSRTTKIDHECVRGHSVVRTQTQ